MQAQWGGNHGRGGRGSRPHGRGWRGSPRGNPRGNNLGPRGGAPFHQVPIDYRTGLSMMRGHRGGYRGRPPPDNYNQQYVPHPNEPPWVRLRGRPYGPPNDLHHRRRFLSPPRVQDTPPVRPSSPLPGSEEYMQRDIIEKSAYLKRQLALEPPPPIPNTTFKPKDLNNSKCDFASDSIAENFCDNPYLQNSNLVIQPSVQNNCNLETPSENVESACRNKRLMRRPQKKQDQVLSVEEIHDKLINHISNLSHGKKVNLVNQAGPSGYDIAVQQITRQKRQELSKALRDMCNNKFKETEDSSDVINAIIPDFDIKIEELPRELVQQLSSTLDENVEERIQTMCIDPELMFRQAANMLNNMFDVDSDVKNDDLANSETQFQDEFPNFSGVVAMDSSVTQNIGDQNTNFVPNDTSMQHGRTDLPYDETMASTALNFHDSIPCQSTVDFSVPPPMNFSVPPPINFGVPPPAICDPQNNELSAYTEYSNPPNNSLNIPDETYNIATTEGGYPERNLDDSQYYSPGQSGSDDNSLQATPIFNNDLMMGQDLLNDNNIEQPLNVDEGGMLPRNPCDNASFSLMEDQESEQYFDLIEDVDDGILMPPNEQPYNLIGGQDPLPENLTEPIELPPVDDVENILLPSESLPIKPVIKEGKAIILSDIRIPPMKVVKQKPAVSDVLKEAAELEACLAQSEADLPIVDTSKSKKISFTFNKINNLIRTNVMEDDNIDFVDFKNSSKKSQPLKITEAVTEEPEKVEVKKEAPVEVVVKLDLEEKIKEEPVVKSEAKDNIVKLDPEPEVEKEVNKKVNLPIEPAVVQPERKTVTKEKVKQDNINEKELLIPQETPIEIEQIDKNKEKSNKKPSKKSKSKSIEKEMIEKTRNSKKYNKLKQKSFEEEDFLEKRKEKKSKSIENEEYPKSDSYKSKFERSRFDIFYSQKYEEGYKKKYKDKGRELVEEDRHRRSDSDRSFEKFREKFRSSDSEHSENRFSKYHQEREETRHSKRYYQDCYQQYRTEYADYKNDYYGPQKYAYAQEYNYSKQDSPYQPEDFEATSSHRTQKHKSKYDKKSHKKRSKKHKKQREKSNTSLSSISSEQRDSSNSSPSSKTKIAKYSDTEEKTTNKDHKIPLKDRIQMLYESKFDKKRDSSYSDYDEDRKIKSEPVSPEVSRKPSPERSRSVEKLQITVEPTINAEDLRDALNKKALEKVEVPKITHPGTPVVPFTNKPCPARKQIEDPLREREEMIMNRDGMISFRDKPCLLVKNPSTEIELEVPEEGELQLAKELPDIDSIAKIISNLSTIVTPTKETDLSEIQTSSEKIEMVVEALQTPEPPKKYEHRPWKSPGEKKFMMEHLQRNPAYEEELYYEANKTGDAKQMEINCYEHDKFVAAQEEKHLQRNLVYEEELYYEANKTGDTKQMEINCSDQEEKPLQQNPAFEEELLYEEKKQMEHDKFVAAQEEKLVFLNPEPTTEVLNEDCFQNEISVVKPTLEKEMPVVVNKIELDEINSTTEKINEPEELKEVSNLLETTKSPEIGNKIIKLKLLTKPESTIDESTKPEEVKTKHRKRNRSKSRSRSKTKERELLHSAEVSSTSDTAAKSLKLSVDKKRKSSTPQPPKEDTKIELTEQPILNPDLVIPENDLVPNRKMLITTYTQTSTEDDKKETHKSRKSSKRDKTHSSSTSSHKSKSKSNISTQTTTTTSINSSTQTPSARSKSVQVQIEVEEPKPIPKKAIFVQTDPVVIFDNYEEADDYDDTFKNADKSKRKILKGVRRRRAVERMFDLDKEIERLTKFRQSLYKKLNFDSESESEEEEEIEDAKTSKKRIKENLDLKNKLDLSKKKEILSIKKKKKNVEELNRNVKNRGKTIVEEIHKADLNVEKEIKNIENEINVEKTKINKMPIEERHESKNNSDIEKPKMGGQKLNEEKHDLLNIEKPKISKTDGEKLKSKVEKHDSINKKEINHEKLKMGGEKLNEEQHDLVNIEKPKINKKDDEKLKPNLENKKERNPEKLKIGGEKLKLNEEKQDLIKTAEINIEKPETIGAEKLKVDEEKPDSISIKKLTENKMDVEKSKTSEEKHDFINKGAINIEVPKMDQIGEEILKSNAEKQDLNNSNDDKLNPNTISGAKSKSNEGKHDVNKNLEGVNITTEKQLINNEKNDLPVEEIIKTSSADGKKEEKLNSLELNTKTSEKKHLNENDIVKQSKLDESEMVVTDLDINNKEMQKPDENRLETITAPVTDLSEVPTAITTKEPPTEENVNLTLTKPERRTPTIKDPQPIPTNPESEASRTTRSRHKKPKESLEDSKSNSRKRERRKTESEETHEHASERRRHRKTTDSDNVDKDSKRHRDSKSPKRSKDKPIIKIKLKTSTEQKNKFQHNLKESKDVKTKRRRTEESHDELSKTIDQVAKNEITGVKGHNEPHFESSSAKRRREKANKTKVRPTKNVRRLRYSKEFDDEPISNIEERVNQPSETQLDPPETQELTSENVAFRGFHNEQDPNQRIEKNMPLDQVSVVSEESIESLNKLNGNTTQKQKKRKKNMNIELDPDIDSQNLLEIQMIKKPKNDLDSFYTDSSSGTPRKKKRYPFSGVKLNYKTKKRKSSSEFGTKTTPLVRKKSITEPSDNETKINQSIVRMTRYSLRQLEEMRQTIRSNKEENTDASNTQEDSGQTLISEIPELHCETDTLLDSKPDLKLVLIESVGLDNLSAEMTSQSCDIIPEEIHFKEELPSIDFIHESDINSALHLETSNEAFEDFVKESMSEYNDNESVSEPPILTPEIDIDEMKIPDSENLEVPKEDEEYKMDFQGFSGAILVIKVIGSTAIAASDKGKVFCFSMLNGNLVNTFDMSKLAITSLIIINKNDTNFIYTGSLDSSVGVLNFNTKEVLNIEKMPEPVQCMEYAWNYIFIGSDRGSLIRYDLMGNKVEDIIKITDSNVLVIKATQEGPRKVLVVATRNAPVSIRDAKSGLLLRTMETPFSPTVYTLLFEKNLIYCGTSQHDILVYTFEDGQLIFKHEATKSKGVVCMQIVGSLLFAGCYNGNIYVYNTKTNIHLGTMNGPGGLMLSMEIVRNKIIVGTKSSNFRAWKIPEKYLDQM